MILLSYILGLSLGIMAIAPAIGYSIPLMVNSFHWLFLVIMSGFMGMFLLSRKLPLLLKILSVYLFITCFFSAVPYLSFNAYILVVLTLYFFLGFQRCDYKIILNIVEAAVWLEVILSIMQLLGKDTLINFDNRIPVFLGTVMQYMRFSSLLACMAPLLMLKNKAYIFLILVLCIVSKSSSFALAVFGGMAVYFLMTLKEYRAIIIIALIACAGGYAFYDNGSWYTEITIGRVAAWSDAIRTWVYDTYQCAAPISKTYMQGTINIKSIFFGRGMDTFLALFPALKQDPCPFLQTHNDWLQYLWELGLVGFSLITLYLVNLINKLYRLKEYLLIAGLVCISINMFFAFPTRITQPVLMIICFLAYCQKKINDSEQPYARYSAGLLQGIVEPDNI